MPETKLDVSKEAVKRLLSDAYAHYQGHFDKKDGQDLYWDGYIRALHHVLEMEGQ